MGGRELPPGGTQSVDLGLLLGQLLIARGDLGFEALHERVDLVHAVATQSLIDPHVGKVGGQVAGGWLRLGQRALHPACGEHDHAADHGDADQEEEQAHGQLSWHGSYVTLTRGTRLSHVMDAG